MMEGSKNRSWEAENKQQNKSTTTDTNTQDALSSLIVRPFSDSTDFCVANIHVET